MRGFRAKDEDRDRFVELIEAAYVDGQIGTEDRELRITRALSAETLDELGALTRDLQLPAGYVAPVATTSPAQPHRVAGMLLALGAVVILIVAGLAALLLFSADVDTATSRDVTVEAPAAPEPAVEESTAPPAASFAMTPGGVRTFVRAYERRFGTLDTVEAVFYPTRVSVSVQVRGSRARYEQWSWEGAWTRTAKAAADPSAGRPVDLGDLDVGRLFDNIVTARKTLNVQRGKLTHVIVQESFDGTPNANIYIGNSFNESGYLMTSPSGDVIRRFPYDA